VTTDPFVVYTSNVLALLGLRALYFLLAGAAGRLRYLRPGLAVILGAVAVKLLLADVWAFPAWSAPAFITMVLAVVAVASAGHGRRARGTGRPREASPLRPSPGSPPHGDTFQLSAVPDPSAGGTPARDHGGHQAGKAGGSGEQHRPRTAPVQHNGTGTGTGPGHANVTGP
jgi:Integral membrane protein TerC family